MNKQAIRNEIELLCKENQELADNDMLLYAAIWRRHGWDGTQRLEDNLRRMPTAANITRRRVELQKDGKISPSPEATNRRFKAFVKERDEHSSLDPLMGHIYPQDKIHGTPKDGSVLAIKSGKKTWLRRRK